MACDQCKKKNKLSNEIEKQISSVQKGTIWFIVICLLFGLFGLVALISVLL